VTDRNPQAKQMADESMVRNLAAQADAIWPQEEPIMRGHGTPATILDLGCGTGEISSRLAALFPAAQVTGVDLIEAHLDLARQRYASFGDRLRFVEADAFELPLADRSFDLVVCRHMLQAVPHAERVMAEMVRVARPGGRLHLLVEDYDMIHAAGPRDPSEFWRTGPNVFGRATGTDLHIGRNAVLHLRDLPVEDVHMHYVVVDTERVPRDTFAAIFEAWRDGYSDDLAASLGWPVAEVRTQFDATIECVRTGYAVWFVPIVTARVR
jgi:SAM-dependent methyltransferase